MRLPETGELSLSSYTDTTLTRYSVTGSRSTLSKNDGRENKSVTQYMKLTRPKNGGNTAHYYNMHGVRKIQQEGPHSAGGKCWWLRPH